MSTNFPIEQVVRKKKDAKYYMNIFLILLGAVGIPVTLFALAFIINLPYLIYISLFVVILCVYLVWFFITSLRVDYEYAFLSSTLKIDRIIDKRKRKPVVKVDVKKFEDFFPYSDKEMSSLKLSKVYHVAAEDYSDKNYVAVYHHEARGKCAIVFQPNEELIEAMKPYLNVELKKKLFLEKRL